MNTLRVVLADDHELVRAGLRALVDAHPGMKVVGEAADGEEAVARACELRPDVLVMDVSMPKMDRAEATERIRRECPGVKVIALTAHDDRAHLTRLLQAGAAGYILKRAAADELVRAIRSVAAGATYVDPVLAGAMLRRTALPAGADPAASADPLSDREEEVLRLDRAAHVAAVEVRHHDVEQHEVRLVPACRGDRLRPTVRLHDPEPGVGEHIGDERRNGGLVVDNEDADRHQTRAPRRAAAGVGCGGSRSRRRGIPRHLPLSSPRPRHPGRS
jgi:DNA-binding NarL/FixJ family response regulator